ncbi:hypothetical protein H257_07297 [Aphanomyces astaci]|uniref:DUF8040 domain-containing protein n=1 Tax=Aphanomyces astaci TaxID=112090 RepID=W4GHP6_APHAT|nr:hypothetical protein H257_07297 [Aphanomyces astaci]ETV79230.1 hypothetical protein H257_07297 [Aphanomyces astaci]|eukprot:XP_009831071.1 hypothetical protein H257_07297 [Aphanomyces astaci]
MLVCSRLSTSATTNEQLGIFLFFAGQHASCAQLQQRFQHSPDTITRHLRHVVTCMNALAATYIQISPNDSHRPWKSTTTPSSIPSGRSVEWQWMELTFLCGHHLWLHSKDEKEYGRGQQAPQSKQELFNLLHAMLWNVVERIFGILKRRFPVLAYAVREEDDLDHELLHMLRTIEHQRYSVVRSCGPFTRTRFHHFLYEIKESRFRKLFRMERRSFNSIVALIEPQSVFAVVRG